MPRLIIDDQEIEVPEGTKVIDAAERLGIVIPRFCYHEALGAVGACRMCAVKFLQGPFKGVQMSCMIDAKDGMVVSTTDEEAVAFRKQVIEWLMINHPHDCPVCDEGGQCLLQDETVSSGHAIRRYPGYKRTYRDQYLGIFIRHEMNRCIHCYRCSRFYQAFSGYRDLGPMQIANRVYFGRFKDGQLDSPFSGNLVDICPVGVYTDKAKMPNLRRWDLERAPSLCIHCSLGCNTIANGRYRATVRIEARFNPLVNGYFICDRGRFSFSYANGGADHTMRPWSARIGSQETARDSATQHAGQSLSRISAANGPDSVAVVGSTRCSLETLATIKRLCRMQGFGDPAFFSDSAVLNKVRGAVSRLDERIAVSLRQIEGADFLLALGVDPINEAPMLALAMRQAWRNGAAVALVDPRPVSMPMDFDHIPVGPDLIEEAVGALMEAAFSKGKSSEGSPPDKEESTGNESPFLTPAMRDMVSNLALRLRKARNPVIICGTDIVRETTPAAAVEHAFFLRESQGKAGVFFLLPGANAYGAELLTSPGGEVFVNILEHIEKGTVKALIVVESDPLRYFPDRERVERALEKLEFLLVLDYLPSEIGRRAHVFLPTTTHFETGSSYINQEGRLQFAEPAHMVGLPLYGAHPPRVYRNYVPGGEPRAAWLVLSDLARAFAPSGKGVPLDPGAVHLRSNEPTVRTETFIPGKEFPTGHVWSAITEEIPELAVLKSEEYPFDNIRVLPAQSKPVDSPPSAARRGAKRRPDDSFELLLVDWMFGTDELSAYSDTIQPIVKEPCMYLHTLDASQFGISDGDTVRLQLDRGSLEAPAKVIDKMAQGIIILPRHWNLPWQLIQSVPCMVPPGNIEKA